MDQPTKEKLLRSLGAIALLTGAFTAAAPVHAQDTTRGPLAAAGPSGARIPYVSSIAADPLGLPFDVFAVEFESAIANGITLGGLGSYTSFQGTSLSKTRYETLEFSGHYYPGEVVLRGLSLGLTASYTWFRHDTTIVGPPAADHTTLGAPALGLNVNYNWMLGPLQRFLIGIGAGAKRVLASEEERKSVGVGRAYPTARFVLGLAF